MDTSTNCKTKLNPAKHVNYAYGMVLGVDDFTQEFAYLSGRDQWMARDILGYGTVDGLKVAIDPGNIVHVTAGTAVNKQGQLIRIDRDQCADLGKWLADEKNRKELESRLGSSPGSEVKIYAVLSYRGCLTDARPIPGEPCRDEKDLMAPSRVMDDYRLKLSFDVPRQCEEREVRAFIKGLGNYVSISDAPGCITTLDQLQEFTQWVSDSILSDSSPPGFGIGSPPALMLIHPDVACAYLRAAFRVWVTELRQNCRPNFLADWCGCAGDPGTQPGSEPEERLLLAELRVTLDGAFGIAAITINEENRPYLLTLRMLQELLLCGRSLQGNGAGTEGKAGPDGKPGPDGNQGADGSPGPDGKPGTDGNKGPDGNPGPDGKQGPDGNKGADGNPGPTGKQGPDGNKGPDGNLGPVGKQGPDGNKGADGNPGPTGKQGPTGLQGPVGLQGPEGKQGPAGDPFIVAAGCFDQKGNQSDRAPYFSFNKLTARQLSIPTFYHLSFEGYKPRRQYVVKGNALASFNSKTASVFEVVLPGDANLRKVLIENGLTAGTGIVVKVMQTNGEVNPLGFMVEISAFGDFSG